MGWSGGTIGGTIGGIGIAGLKALIMFALISSGISSEFYFVQCSQLKCNQFIISKWSKLVR